MEPSSRTLSAPVTDAQAVFAYSATDEMNKMQYLSNTQTVQKHFHEQQKHFLYIDTAPSVQEKSSTIIYYLNTNKVGVYMLLSVFYDKRDSTLRLQ